MERTLEDYKKTFMERFKKLRGGLSAERLSKSIYKKTNVLILQPRVSKLEHGTALPTGEEIWSIASYFGISADYLLSLSDSKSLDPNHRQFQKKTGISDEAIDVLEKCTEKGGSSQATAQIVNVLLTTKAGGKILGSIKDILYNDFRSQWIEASQNTSPDPDTFFGRDTIMDADDYQDMLSARVIRLLAELKMEVGRSTK